MGHGEGDRLIRDTAARMKLAFRTDDLIARLGGDEFSLLLTDTSPETASDSVDRLRMATPARGVFSAGIAIADPGETLADLQRRGDLALYEAKSQRGSRTILAATGCRRLTTGADRLRHMAKVKLHRCNYTFLHLDLDACWKVQRALDEQGVDYEIVKQGWGKGRRDAVEKLSGQSKLPVLELADGEVYRAESDDMAARVRAGNLPAG